jgi:hypothetical protein
MGVYSRMIDTTEWSHKIKQAVARKPTQFQLLIGDEGAILCFINKGKLETRLFAPSADSKEAAEFSLALDRHPDVPIVLVLDVMDLEFKQQFLPPVNRYTVVNLARSKMKREYDRNTLFGPRLMYRKMEGKREWVFLFCSCPISPVIAAWQALIQKHQNTLQSHMFLPLESQRLMQNPVFVNHRPVRAEKEMLVLRDHWQIMVSHHKISGFRQLVFRNGQMLLTRLINADQEKFADVISGTVEQEIHNTVDYLKRMVEETEIHFDVVIVAEREITQHTDHRRIGADKVQLFTPYEFARYIGLDESFAKDGDRFNDIVLSGALAFSIPLLPMHIPETQRLVWMALAAQSSGFISQCLGVMLILQLLYAGYSTYSLNTAVSDAKDKAEKAQDNWDLFRKNNPIDIDKAYGVTEAVKLYKLLTENNIDPLTFLRQFKRLEGGEIIVRNFSWKRSGAGASDASKTEKTSTRTSKKAGGTAVDTASANAKGFPTMQANLDIRFMNTGSGFQGLFASFDVFTARLLDEFKDYNVDYTRALDQISFTASSDSLPAKVSVSGPKSAPSKPAVKGASRQIGVNKGRSQ